jgi:predicted enzyme related to lactoylglutathione lyase
MGIRSEYAPGTFSWADLATSDTDGAKRFYGELFGWEAEDLPVGDGAFYSMCRIGGRSVAAIGALMQDQIEQGIPPHFNNYVTVEDVDATTGRAQELGATVAAPPFDVMEAGRMSVIQDPTGAHLSLWQARESIGAQLVNETGSLTWNDLNTGDPDRAQTFYEALFGWSFEKVPGDLDYWMIRNGERTNGGVLRFERGPAFWLPYFAVEDVEDAAARASEAGGGKHAGPMEVPNGRIAVLHDPAGAVFAVYEGEFDD